jgi:hypothetical protein
MTFTDNVVMHNVGNIRISDGAVISLRSPTSSLGLSDSAVIEGAGTTIFVNQSSIFGGYANIVIRDGPKIVVDQGAFIVRVSSVHLIVSSFLNKPLMFFRPLVSMNSKCQLGTAPFTSTRASSSLTTQI